MRGCTRVRFLLLFLLVFLLFCFCCKQGFVEAFRDEDPMIFEIHALLSAVDAEAAKSITCVKDEKSFTVNKKHMHLCLMNENGDYFNKKHAHIRCTSRAGACEV